MSTPLTTLEQEAVRATAGEHWPGFRHGPGFIVEVRDSRISRVEIFTCGNESWDGVERTWKVI
jgi:hypothetical protein